MKNAIILVAIMAASIATAGTDPYVKASYWAEKNGVASFSLVYAGDNRWMVYTNGVLVTTVTDKADAVVAAWADDKQQTTDADIQQMNAQLRAALTAVISELERVKDAIRDIKDAAFDDPVAAKAAVEAKNTAAWKQAIKDEL